MQKDLLDGCARKSIALSHASDDGGGVTAAEAAQREHGDISQTEPRLLKLRAEGNHQQHRKVCDAKDDAV